MGSFVNFENVGDIQPLEGSTGKMTTTGNALLARQSSVYSLTFDELQGTFSGFGKDYGSMNIEDLLKNIWTAEENQAFATSAGAGNGIAPSGILQRQGSLTLPRTLSQKTVDDVWRDMFKESITGANDGDTAGLGGSSLGPRQNTLGEMTLEEFLLRAGIAKENPQPYGALAQPCGNSSGLSTGFQPGLNQNVLGNQFLENGNPLPSSSNNIILNFGGTEISQQEQHKEVQSQHQSLFSNEVSMPFSSGLPVLNSNYQISSPQAKVPGIAMSNSNNYESSSHQTKVPGIAMSNSNNYEICSHQTKVPGIAMSNSSLNSMLVQHSVIQDGAAGLAGLCNLPASGVAISPANHISSTVTAKRKLDTPPMVPLYTIGEGIRGRRSNSSLEKVVERRRKRMIKNRESAARSRQRKQAYTLELEAEVANLKEINQKLQKKQAEFMEKQKLQMLEMMKMPSGGKRKCLERTLTGPW